MGIINFIKRDFWNVSFALAYFNGGKPVKTWVALLYYVPLAIVMLLLAPFVWLWYKYQIKKINKLFKEWEEA